MAKAHSGPLTHSHLNSNLRRLCLVAACVSLASAALAIAQTPASSASVASAGAPAATIRNAAFTAEVATSYDRVLPNHKYIHSEAKAKVFRDSQGRVRTETELTSSTGNSGTYRRIVIQDPVSREVIHLHGRTKTADIHHLGDLAARVPDAPGPAIANAAAAVNPTDAQTQSASLSVPLQHSYVLESSKIEPLGKRMVQGIMAVGTRTKRVFRDTDGVSTRAVSEVWYSPQWQIVVLSTWDDGQFGHGIIRVTNIVRAVPNEQLFQVPADYTVKDDSPIAAVIKH